MIFNHGDFSYYIHLIFCLGTELITLKLTLSDKCIQLKGTRKSYCNGLTYPKLRLLQIITNLLCVFVLTVNDP